MSNTKIKAGQNPFADPPVASKAADVFDLLKDEKLITRDHAIAITPDLASALLSLNTRNRTINLSAVRQYVGAMQRGEWVYNGRAIVVSEEGVLLDGQHTLTAVVQSGVTIEALIAVGVDHQTQSTMDAGRKRTFGDVLHLMGEKNSSDLAACLRVIFAYETIGVPSTERLPVQPTNEQLFEILDRHPGVRDAVSWANKKGNKPWFMVASRAASLYYLFSTYNEEDAEKFFSILAHGEGIEIGNPIHTLRERLIRDKMEPGKRLRSDAGTAFTVKAFNAWREGIPLKRLLIKMGGASPEQFPQIEALEDDKIDHLKPGRSNNAIRPQRISKTNKKQIAKRS